MHKLNTIDSEILLLNTKTLKNINESMMSLPPKVP